MLSGPHSVYSWLVHLECEECTAESSEWDFSNRTLGRGEILALIFFSCDLFCILCEEKKRLSIFKHHGSH